MMPAEEIIHPEDRPRVREVLRRLEYSEHAPITYRGRRKDGTYIWVEAGLTRSNNPETGASEVVSVVRDISERVRDGAALRQAKEEAGAASRAKSGVLGETSAALGDPLKAIVGFTGGMLDGGVCQLV